jgi:hypothetical protein
MDYAEAINRYRVFPRLIVLFVLFLTWEVTEWFMQLNSPGSEQAAFASALTAGTIALIKFYLETPKRDAAGQHRNETSQHQ